MLENTIQLPRTTKGGKPRFSYSQYRLWKDKVSFNLNKEGWIEYICHYFLGYDWADAGWGEFGHDVEDYVTLRIKEQRFTEKEKFTMDKIKPLGNFQQEIEVDLGGFIFLSIIDDATEDFRRIRDYKTASENSSKQYRQDDYWQLDSYGLAIKKKFGFIPEAEVCIIERKGNAMFGGGRKSLSVGEKIWYVPRLLTEDRLSFLEQDIIKTVHEVSEYYKIFRKINSI